MHNRLEPHERGQWLIDTQTLASLAPAGGRLFLSVEESSLSLPTSETFSLQALDFLNLVGVSLMQDTTTGKYSVLGQVCGEEGGSGNTGDLPFTPPCSLIWHLFLGL